MTYKYQVAVCKDTGKEVVQVNTGKNWICMHKEFVEADAISVEAFKAAYSDKNQPIND